MQKQLTIYLILLFITSCSNIKILNKAKPVHKNVDIKITNVEKESSDTDIEDWFSQKVMKEDPKPVQKYRTTFLKNTESNSLRFWIKYYSKMKKKRFQYYLDNGLKYKKEIEQIFTDNGLPKELFFVGLIESGYSTRAKSRANAVGPWQFIRPTARRYGLKINKFVDERRDIIKSTKAAASHFKILFNMFGSWELALAGYNQGENGLRRRIKKYQVRDFYTLSRRRIIPKETRHYIPKVLAAIHLYKNYKKYGFMKRFKKPYYYGTKEIKLNHSNSLNSISRKTGLSIREIKKHNPDLVGWYTPKIKKRGFNLRIPQNISRYLEDKNFRRPSIEKFDTSFTKNTYAKYRVKRGDNLIKIARVFKTSIKKLKRINKIKSNRIYIGQKLKVPGVIYKVKKGDYLLKIASKYEVTAKEIQAINNLKSSMVYPGQKLVVR